LSGLKVSILERRSAAVGLILGNSFSQDCRDRFGNDFMYFIAFSFPK
jgi:Mn2+/Fe2+ NRAMP family transporter